MASPDADGNRHGLQFGERSRLCSVENAERLLAGVRMDGYEQDVQVAKDGACDGVEGCNGHPSQIQSSLQPQEVHAASVVRLPRLEGLSESRLSRLGRPPARHARMVRSDRTGRSAAFHYVSEGGSTLVASSARGPTAERNRRADHGAKASCAVGGHRLDRPRIASHEPLLHSPTQPGAQPLANHAIHAISEARHSSRLLEPCGPGLLDGSRSKAGHSRPRSNAGPNLSSCTNRMADRRCGLRQRVEPSAVPRRTWHSFADSSEARPSHEQAGQRPLPAIDAEAIRQSPLRPALASGNGGKYDEASPRIGPQRSELLVPPPRPDAHGPDPQHHDPLTV